MATEAQAQIDRINAEINSQADQIDELREILANKAAASPVVEKLTVTENGTYTPPSGTDGYAPVNVNVPAPEPVVVPLNVTENGTYEAPDGTDGYSPVNVNVPSSAPAISPLNVTENGTYTAPDGTDGYSPVTVNVQPKLQEKSVTPSTQAQEVTPDSGYDGMSKVNVGAVKTAEQATPSITVGANGLITAKTNQSEGYVSGGEKSATNQLPTMAGKTVTPSAEEQTVVSAGTFVTDDIKVAKIPSGYIKPNGTKAITENGTHDVTSFSSVDVNVPSSGGGYPTCTINVELEDMKNVHVSFYRVVDGSIVRETPIALEDSNRTTTTIAVTNVLCASMITISVEAISYEFSENLLEEFFDGDVGYIVAPINPGDVGRMYFLRD